MVSWPLILMSSTATYCEYWSEMQLARCVELLAIFRRPPVAQVALGVELAAFVVEAVGQFMSNGGAGVAVVRGIVGAGIEKGRLQNPAGKLMSFSCGL